MTESTGFTIRVVEVAVSIPTGRAMGISQISELVEGDSTAVVNVLREHKDDGLPWWRIVTDEGAPVFGTEHSGRALERYLLEATPIVPSSSDFGFAVDLVAAAIDAPIAASLESSLSDDTMDGDDPVENAPQWAGAPVSARSATQEPIAVQPEPDTDTDTDTGESTDETAEPAADDAANADASGDAEAQPGTSAFSFDALLRGESSRMDDGGNRTS